MQEEQEAQQDSRFLNGRQIAHMIFDYFKHTGIGEALLDFNVLLRVQLKKNDNVQGFDTEGDEVPLSMTKVPDYSEELNLLMSLCLQDTVEKGKLTSYPRLTQRVCLLCGAENKGQPFQCPEQRQVSSKSSSTQRKSSQTS